MDLMAVTDGMIPLMQRSQVLLDHTASDHRYVVHDFAEEAATSGRTRQRWNARMMDRDPAKVERQKDGQGQIGDSTALRQTSH